MGPLPFPVWCGGGRQLWRKPRAAASRALSALFTSARRLAHRAALSAWDCFPRIFFSAPPCSSRLLPSSVSPASMDMMDSCLMTTVLCIILMAGYNLIPASCLITVGMNTKHTLRGRWEETQPRRKKLYFQMSLTLLVACVMNSNQNQMFFFSIPPKRLRTCVSGKCRCEG